MSAMKSNWAANRKPQQLKATSPEWLRSGSIQRYVAGDECQLSACRISETL